MYISVIKSRFCGFWTGVSKMNGTLCGQLLPMMIKAIQDGLNDAALGDFVVKQSSRATYDDTSFTVKIEVRENVVHESGVVMTKEANDFLRYVRVIGMAKSDLGRVIEVRGSDYRIVGYRSRARKFPILVEIVKTGEKKAFALDYTRSLVESQFGSLEERGGETVTLTQVKGLLGGAS